MSWKIMELGKVCERVSVGHVGKTSEFYTDESGIPFLRTQNVSSDGVNTNDIKYITSEFHKSLKKSTLCTGDLILSRVISNRINCGIIPEELNGANCANIILVRPKKELLDANFLNHYLKSELVQKDLLKRQVGSAQSVVNTAVLKTWEIPLPPLADQQKIAAILDAADSLRQKDQQLVERYTALSQSLFLEMFGDPVTNPMGWQTNKLSNVIRMFGGGTPSKDIDEYWGGNIPWATVKDLKNSTLISTQDSITKLGLDNSSSKIVKAGTIIMATRMAVGRAVKAGIDVAINQDLKALVCTDALINEFLFRFLVSKESYFNSISSGATVKGIKISDINELTIILPPLELQKKFANAVSLVEAQKHQAQRSLEKSEALFNSLLQRAFTGELTAKMAA